MTDTAQVTPVAIGDAVKVVTEDYVETFGLVTAVHGNFDQGFTPCINVVYVAPEAAKSDSYGRQTERMSSLQHLSQGPSNMPKPGRYWVNV